MKSQFSPRAAKSFVGGFAPPSCPQCAELQVAPALSVHVSETDVCHWWSCDACAHQFMTSVRFSETMRKVS